MNLISDLDRQALLEQVQIYLVIPALNEEENLRLLLPKLVPYYQVIVVDNNSTYATAQVAQESGATVLFWKERGYGGAVNQGFLHVLKEESLTPGNKCVVVFDADGTSPVECISAVAEPVLKGSFDLVLAQRTTQERGAMPAHAQFGNVLQTFLIHLLTGVRYLDMGPLRALSISAIKQLEMQDRNWGWNVEMQVKAALYGMRFTENEINYRRRIYGKSKISGTVMGSAKAGLKILYAVFYYTWKGLRKRNIKKMHQGMGLTGPGGKGGNGGTGAG